MWVFEFCQNLGFWLLSQFEFLNFVKFWGFEFCHNLSCWLGSQFEFLSFVTIWVSEFCHNLSFQILSKFDSTFCHNLTFRVLSHTKNVPIVTTLTTLTTHPEYCAQWSLWWSRCPLATSEGDKVASYTVWREQESRSNSTSVEVTLLM